MDLSAVIFVVLALAWAVYLIPKALQHHDEMAGDRLEQAHTEKVRVLSRQRRREVRAGVEDPQDTADTVPDTASGDQAPVVETETEVVAERVVETPVRLPEALPTRATARRAARNRRRVLTVLLLATIATAVCAWYAVVPAWAPAIPGALVVVFLVVARMSVRRMQAARRAPVSRATAPAAAATVAPAAVPAAVEEPAAATAMTERLAEPELSDAERRDLEAALADDGSLWDPLPMTLPTYVGKARARRTVRTIELTGMTSSGHDAADTTLAREAREAEVTASAEAEATPAERRKAAGA